MIELQRIGYDRQSHFRQIRLPAGEEALIEAFAIAGQVDGYLGTEQAAAGQ